MAVVSVLYSEDKHIEVAQIVDYHHLHQVHPPRLSEELFAFLDSYETKNTSKEEVKNV